MELNKRELDTGIVVDRKSFDRLSNDQLIEALDELKGFKDVVFTDITKFFSKPEIVKGLESGTDEKLSLRLEGFGIQLTDETRKIMTDFYELRTRILEVVDSFVPPVPPYEFAETPDNFNPEKYFTFRDDYGYRKVNTPSSGSYSITVDGARRVFDAFVPKWAAGRTTGPRISVSSNGYKKSAWIDGTKTFRIGCKTFRRWELEQLGLLMGWEFPKTA